MPRPGDTGGPSGLNRLILRLKRGETPFWRALKKVAGMILFPRVIRLPAFLKPPLAVLYGLHFGAIGAWRAFSNIVYFHPIFQARTASMGEGVSIDRLPFVEGHTEIHIGNHCRIGGGVSIASGRVIDRPLFVLKDYAELGWNVHIVVNKEVVIEEHARISYDCRISDSDGHPREADRRAQNQPPDPRDIRSVRIGRHVWLGNGTHVMKGVTIGEGAVIGANSVVISDIPPYCLALGNPAEVLLRNFGRPSRPSPDEAAPSA